MSQAFLVPGLDEGAAAPPPFTPASIAGLVVWLKADAGTYQDSAFTTPASADGDPVGGWQDQSGNSNHVTQATGTKRGTLKLAVKNGLPIIRFDGVDDTLQNTLFSGINNVTGYTYYCVFSNQVLTNQFLFTVNNTTIRKCVHQIVSSSDYRQWASISNTDSESIATFGTTGNWWLHEGLYDGTQVGNSGRLNFYLNGTLQSGSYGGTIPANLNQATTGYGVGDDAAGTKAFQGDIGEIVLYNSALSGANQALVQAYLNTRFGIF